MSNDEDICGSTDTSSGNPCQNPADSCPWHGTDDPPDNGRPTKLTEERARNITGSIAEGKSVTSAARMAGVHPATVYAWLEKGEDADADDNPYADFHDRFVRARGLGEDAYVDDILELAREEGDLATMMSMLKQRYPESWGDVDRGEQASGVNVYLDADETAEIDPETLEVIDD